ncbi:MAG: AI-2E family transporter [Gemmatimonas sp.]
MTIPDTEPELETLAREHRPWSTANVGRAALVVFGVWFGLQLLWSVSSLFFLVFLAILFGLAVGRGVDKLERYKIRRGVASALIVFGTVGVIGGGLALSAPTLIEQGRELQTEFPDAVSKVQDWVDSKQRTGVVGSLIKAASQPATPPGTVVAPPPTTAAGRRAAAAARPSDAIKQRLADGLARASGYLFSFVSSTLAVVAAFFLLIFLAIYVGAEPEVYRGWMLAAVPAHARPQARRVLSEIATVLRKWLVTQLIAMVVIGTVCTIVLLLLGVKAPFALGFIAGLMEFIPNLGPVLSAIPAVVMGFVDSPEKAAAVALAYWAIQFLENNLLIPYLMRGEMDLPPAITLVGQALMAVLFGFLGLMVAVPLIAVVLVPIRMIAERENAKEKALLKAARRTGNFQAFAERMRVTAEHALTEADRGPSPGDLAEDDS